MIFGLDLTHMRGDLYRALFEAIAYATNHILETYEEAGEAPRPLLAAGGGVRNRVGLQATSDVSGRTQTLREKTLGAAYGNAFLAALALGEVRRGLADARVSDRADAGTSRRSGNLRELLEKIVELGIGRRGGQQDRRCDEDHRAAQDHYALTVSSWRPSADGSVTGSSQA